MAHQDQTLRPSLPDRIDDVEDRLPFGGLARHQHLDLGGLERLDLPLATGCAGEERDLGDSQTRIADHPQGADAQSPLDLPCQILEGGLGKAEAVRLVRALEGGPAQGRHHSLEDPIGLARRAMPVVVKAPDHEVVLLDVGELSLEHRVVAQPGGFVEVVIEGRLVGDDEVRLAGGRPLQHIHGRREGGGDPGDRGVGIARLERIDGGTSPRLPVVAARVVLDALDDLAGGQA